MSHIYIRKKTDESIMATLDVTKLSQKDIEQIISGILSANNDEQYYVDDSEIKKGTPPCGNP